MPEILLNDFSGGMRKDSLRCAENESALIEGLWPEHGALVSMRAPVVVENSVGTNLSDERSPQIHSMDSYVTDEGINCLVTKRGRSIWLDVPQMDYERDYGGAYTDAAVTFALSDNYSMLKNYVFAASITLTNTSNGKVYQYLRDYTCTNLSTPTTLHRVSTGQIPPGCSTLSATFVYRSGEYGWAMRDAGDDVFSEGIPPDPGYYYDLTAVGAHATKLWSGRVRRFDGAASHLVEKLSRPGKFNASENISVLAWVCPDAMGLDGTSNTRTIVSRTGVWYNTWPSGWRLYHDGYGNVGFMLGSETWAGSPPVVTWIGGFDVKATEVSKRLAANTWYLVAVTYTQNAYPKIYVFTTSGTGGESATYDIVAGSATGNYVTQVSHAACGQKFRIGYDPHVVDYWDTVDGFAGMMGTVSFHNHNVYSVFSAANLQARALAEGIRFQRSSSIATYESLPLHLGSYRASEFVGTGTGVTLDPPDYTEQSYLPRRAVAGGETFVQQGQTLYATPDDPGGGDFVLAVRGQPVSKGRVTGYKWPDPERYGLGMFEYSPVGTETSGTRPWRLSGELGWLKAYTGQDQSILPGDTIYLKDRNGRWNSHGHIIRYASTTPSGQGKIWVYGAGANTGGPVEYCIVRCHRAGVGKDEGGYIKAAEVASPFTDSEPWSTPGRYYFRYRYANSKTGYVGPLSEMSVGIDGTAKTWPYLDYAGGPLDGHSLCLYSSNTEPPVYHGWSEWPEDVDVDLVQIYACVEGNSTTSPAWFDRTPWYLLCEIPLVEELDIQVANATPGSYWIDSDGAGSYLACMLRRPMPTMIWVSDYSVRCDFPSTEVGYWDVASPVTHPLTIDYTCLWTQQIPLESDASLKARPPALRYIHHYNGRLWGVDAEHPGYLRFSDLGLEEYMPEVGSSGPLVTASTGGFLELGSAADPVQTFVPETGNFANTGRTGANILVMMRYHSKRVFGNTWDDFQVLPAFGTGTSSPRSVQHCGSVIMWASSDGDIAILPVGGDKPQFIGDRLFPRGATSEITTDVRARLATWHSAYWSGNYILGVALASSTPSKLCIYNLDANSWTTIDSKVSALLPFARSDDITQLALLAAGNDTWEGTIYELFYYGNQSGEGQLITRPLSLVEGSELDLQRRGHIKRVHVCYRVPKLPTPPLHQSMRLSVYADGDLVTPAYGPVSPKDTTIQEISGTPTGRRAIARYALKGQPHAYFVQLGLALTYCYDTQIEWILIEYEGHGNVQ